MEAVIRKAEEKMKKALKRSAGGTKYFATMRRGETAELQEELNSSDVTRQKPAVKRVIASITMGRDVSMLFVDVVKLGQTTNLELKKLVYLYILNMARLQPDKALLAVNTFLQDCSNTSPIVRALAVRTMLCIRVDDVLEYTLEPLRRAVVDTDPYVRKTAAIGLGKLFHHNMDLFYDQKFANELIKLLRDSNPTVSGNAAAVVAEVNDYGPLVIEMKVDWMNRILLQLSECNEWGQQYMLDVLASYKPATEEAAEDLVARIISRLNHTNPAIVLGAIKIIANVANKCNPSSLERFTARINAALLTLTRSNPETQFVLCKNIHALLVIFPNVMRSDLDAFYVRFNDPTYVKLEKIHLLLKLVTPATAGDIVKEFAEYATEVDHGFVQEVVRTVASLAIKVDSVAPDCADLLMQLVERRPELLPQVVTAAKNIVRKYPELLLLDPLIKDFGADNVVEEEAKVSLIWMLGEYCDFVENGVVILQRFIDTLMSHETSVQLAVLSAVIKMFIRDPQGMQSTLNQVLETITQKSSDPDVRDRAFAYWRLLSKGIGVSSMKEIVHGQTPPINVDNTFSDAMTMGDLKKSINTAAVVFGKPYQSFLPPYGLPDNEIDEEEEEDYAGEEEAGEVPKDRNPTGASPKAVNTAAAAAPASPSRQADVLDDLFDTSPKKSESTSSPNKGSNLDDLFS